MTARETILKAVKQKGSVKTPALVKLLGISRQAVARYCRELVLEGKLVRLYSTRRAEYVLPKKGKKIFSAAYPLRGLEEDKVLREIDLRMGLKKLLSPEAYRIVGYAFSEMLNNAIDHSRSQKTKIHLSCDGLNLKFEILDGGVGVFENVRKKFKLATHFESADHLLKGKQTTDLRHHSGQGIFFTSKAADRFILESARLRLIVDNGVEDTFLEDIRGQKGTRVQFILRQKSKKSLKKIFDEYSNDDTEFDKTKITVHLLGRETEHISRSQAKRLLFGLEKFKRIVLDFKKVTSIGQGFADEIFRVYQNLNPGIQIEALHTAPAVGFMIKRSRMENR